MCHGIHLALVATLSTAMAITCPYRLLALLPLAQCALSQSWSIVWSSIGVYTLFHRRRPQHKQTMNLGEEAVKAWEEAEFDGLESWTILWSISASANPYCRLVMILLGPKFSWMLGGALWMRCSRTEEGWTASRWAMGMWRHDAVLALGMRGADGRRGHTELRCHSRFWDHELRKLWESGKERGKEKHWNNLAAISGTLCGSAERPCACRCVKTIGGDGARQKKFVGRRNNTVFSFELGDIGQKRLSMGTRDAFVFCVHKMNFHLSVNHAKSGKILAIVFKIWCRICDFVLWRHWFEYTNGLYCKSATHQIGVYAYSYLP